ncbi:TadE/TadG family type IV pilus assembly protein [Pseudarthrobacter sp. BIM B-2242]|uniref:TadE/TadG family type IV pilus assembly protein n=1 Tax=Pseudarthrobacter sp. BIM B-2242 TaxID=2772401 RepID=UPI00168B0527|nr:TadE/TadG family type IV pilus assembly protein [Pseudarthrobacter sp. BIM B-2242]QOD02401.1 pilus assembly protein [Pseudarthrobacter sp. BIM B-2242]
MLKTKKERGAVAVEMAILLPLLLMLLIGTIEFGRVFNVQISLNQAAREGARHAAIHYGDPTLDVEGTALAAAPSLDNLTVLVTDNATECADDGANVEVIARTTLNSVSGLFDVELLGMPVIFPLELTGRGVMRCGG